MTKKELLTACRENVTELADMERQLRTVGSDGRPAALHGIQTDGVSGTNHPAASAWQLADGLETRIARKRIELAELTQQALEYMQQISSLRTYMIIEHYYLLGETDEQIGLQLAISRARVTQIRQRFLYAS